MSLLGLDIGTTGCKAIIFREDGVPLGGGYRECYSGNGGFAECKSGNGSCGEC